MCSLRAVAARPSAQRRRPAQRGHPARRPPPTTSPADTQPAHPPPCFSLEFVLALERAIDTVVWQLLASVFVPGFTIHTVVALVTAGLSGFEGLPAVQDAAAAASSVTGVAGPTLLALAAKSVPTAAGLAAIPFIVHPIDNAIHALLNVSLRPALRAYVCGAGQGKAAALELCDDCGPWAPKKGAAKKQH